MERFVCWNVTKDRGTVSQATIIVLLYLFCINLTCGIVISFYCIVCYCFYNLFSSYYILRVEYFLFSRLSIINLCLFQCKYVNSDLRRLIIHIYSVFYFLINFRLSYSFIRIWDGIENFNYNYCIFSLILPTDFSLFSRFIGQSYYHFFKIFICTFISFCLNVILGRIFSKQSTFYVIKRKVRFLKRLIMNFSSIITIFGRHGPSSIASLLFI